MARDLPCCHIGGGRSRSRTTTSKEFASRPAPHPDAAADNPPAVGAVMSVGIPVGVGVRVFTIAIAAIRVRRANGEFDDMKRAIVKQAST